MQSVFPWKHGKKLHFGHGLFRQDVAAAQYPQLLFSRIARTGVLRRNKTNV
jgi:hypothetical protein